MVRLEMQIINNSVQSLLTFRDLLIFISAALKDCETVMSQLAKRSVTSNVPWSYTFQKYEKMTHNLMYNYSVASVPTCTSSVVIQYKDMVAICLMKWIQFHKTKLAKYTLWHTQSSKGIFFTNTLHNIISLQEYKNSNCHFSVINCTKLISTSLA
jgi:hypothetical protein